VAAAEVPQEKKDQEVPARWQTKKGKRKPGNFLAIFR